MRQVTVHEAKTHLSKLLVEVEKGVEVTICRGSEPVALLGPIPVETPKRPRVGEITSGPIVYDANCFAPLTDKELEDWGL